MRPEHVTASSQPALNPLKARWSYVPTLVVLLMVAAVEGAVLWAYWNGLIRIEYALIFHAAVVLGLVLAIGRGQHLNLDTGIMSIGFVLVLIAGPVGSISAVLIHLTTFGGRLETAPLMEWYERISLCQKADPATEWYEKIISGRLRIGTTTTPSHFQDVLKGRSLKKKQIVLGLMATRYHPDFFPMLRAALKDEQLPVRVQAAAIMAKLRSRYKKELTDLIDPARRDRLDARSAIGLAGAIHDCLCSGFLDTAEERRARIAGVDLCSTALVLDGDHYAASRLLKQFETDRTLTARTSNPWFVTARRDLDHVVSRRTYSKKAVVNGDQKCQA